MIKIAVDAMGGDNAPSEIVKGAVEAVSERPDITVCLTGQEDIIKKELEKYTYKKEQIDIVPASEVIETGEPPVNAIRKKKDSSIVVGMNLVKRGEAHAVGALAIGARHRSERVDRKGGDRGKDQRRRAASAGSSDPHGKGIFPSH